MAVEDTRDAIMDATLRTAARFGLAKLSVEDVAREAEVSRQTVYRYFGSREGLISAVILREEQELMTRLIAAADAHDELRPALEAALVVALHSARAHPLLDRLLADEPEALLPFLTTGAGPVLSAARPVVVELLGRYAPHLSDAELALTADAASRLLLSYAVQPGDEPPETLAAGLADLIVNGVKG